MLKRKKSVSGTHWVQRAIFCKIVFSNIYERAQTLKWKRKKRSLELNVFRDSHSLSIINYSFICIISVRSLTLHRYYFIFDKTKMICVCRSSDGNAFEMKIRNKLPKANNHLNMKHKCFPFFHFYAVLQINWKSSTHSPLQKSREGERENFSNLFVSE